MEVLVLVIARTKGDVGGGVSHHVCLVVAGLGLPFIYGCCNRAVPSLPAKKLVQTNSQGNQNNIFHSSEM